RGEEQKRGLEPTGALNAGQREGGYCGADRSRGLANAEREASLLAAEPRHHRPAARGVDAGARSAGGAKQDDEGGEARRERHRDRERRAEAEPGGEDTTLADAVSRQAPGGQRADRTDPRRGDQHTYPRQAQPQVVAQRRSHHGRRRQQREIRGLTARARGENGQAVAADVGRARRQGPNGSNGSGVQGPEN